MPSLIRKEKSTCEDCGTQTTRKNIVRRDVQLEHCVVASVAISPQNPKMI